MAEDTGPTAEGPATPPDASTERPSSEVEEGFVELSDDTAVLSDEEIAAAAAFLASVGEDQAEEVSDTGGTDDGSPAAPPGPGPAAPAGAGPSAEPPPPTEPPPPAAPPPPEEPPYEEPPEGPSVADAAADLIQTVIDYARQETEALMREKVVAPLQQLGLTVSSASAAGCLFALGLGFIAVAVLLVLAGWLGWPGALALVGAVLLIGSAVFTFVKVRSMQK